LSVWEVNYLLARLTVGQVMTRNVVSIAPDRDPREAAGLLARAQDRRAPGLSTGTGSPAS